jgi:hypothetical protein
VSDPATTDRVRFRREGVARRGPRGGPERTSGPVREDHRQARSEARSSLEIVHAQYHREVTRAARSEAAERAGALAEAHRLLKVAVALRGRVTREDVGGIAARVPAERHDPAHRYQSCS